MKSTIITVEELPLNVPTAGYGSYKLISRELSHVTKGGRRMFDVVMESTQNEAGQPKGHRIEKRWRGDAKLSLAS